MNKSAKFWDKIAHKYAKRPVSNQEAYEKKLAKSREYMSSESSVLELGCGTGSTALAHAPFVKQILATDISAGMLEIAESKLRNSEISNLLFEQGSIESLDFPSATFDVIMAHSLLHLVEDKELAMEKIHTWLKPNGIFISSTACLGDFMAVFKLIAPVGKFLRLIPLVKVFTADQLKESMNQIGFEIQHEWKPAKNEAVFIVARKAE